MRVTVATQSSCQTFQIATKKDPRLFSNVDPGAGTCILGMPVIS